MRGPDTRQQLYSFPPRNGPRKLWKRNRARVFFLTFALLPQISLALLYRVPNTLSSAHQQQRASKSNVPLFVSNHNETAASIDSKEGLFHKLPRLYVGGNKATLAPLALGVHVELSPEQAHYVTKVMRIGVKKSTNLIRIFDGTHGEWLAQVCRESADDENTNKSSRRRLEGKVVAQCQRQLRVQPTPHESNDPWLLFAPIKKARVKMLLEKATELGVGRLMPIRADRCDPSSVRDCCRSLEKYSIHTIEAAEQCERLTIPALTMSTAEFHSSSAAATIDKPNDPLTIEQLLQAWTLEENLSISQHRHLLFCRERSASFGTSLLRVLHETIPNQHGVAFVVGPEGGWSDEEEAMVDEYCCLHPNIHGTSLGSLVLRAETAAIAALSAYMLNHDSRNH